MRTTITTLAGLSALLILTACSGGGGGSNGPTYASSLTYTNPASGAFQLVKDPASSGGNLVLDLVCTNGTPVAGVSFSFTADTTKATWTSTTAASISSGTAFNLGNAPQAAAAKMNSSELSGAVSQKGTASPITPTSTTVLAKVTLTLKPNVAPGAITLADSGKSAYLDGTGVHAVTISAGSLAAQ